MKANNLQCNQGKKDVVKLLSQSKHLTHIETGAIVERDVGRGGHETLDL